MSSGALSPAAASSVSSASFKTTVAPSNSSNKNRNDVPSQQAPAQHQQQRSKPTFNPVQLRDRLLDNFQAIAVSQQQQQRQAARRGHESPSKRGRKETPTTVIETFAAQCRANGVDTSAIHEHILYMMGALKRTLAMCAEIHQLQEDQRTDRYDEEMARREAVAAEKSMMAASRSRPPQHSQDEGHNHPVGEVEGESVVMDATTVALGEGSPSKRQTSSSVQCSLLASQARASLHSPTKSSALKQRQKSQSPMNRSRPVGRHQSPNKRAQRNLSTALESTERGLSKHQAVQRRRSATPTMNHSAALRAAMVKKKPPVPRKEGAFGAPPPFVRSGSTSRRPSLGGDLEMVSGADNASMMSMQPPRQHHSIGFGGGGNNSDVLPMKQPSSEASRAIQQQRHQLLTGYTGDAKETDDHKTPGARYTDPENTTMMNGPDPTNVASVTQIRMTKKTMAMAARRRIMNGANNKEKDNDTTTVNKFSSATSGVKPLNADRPPSSLNPKRPILHPPNSNKDPVVTPPPTTTLRAPSPAAPPSAAAQQRTDVEVAPSTINNEAEEHVASVEKMFPVKHQSPSGTPSGMGQWSTPATDSNVKAPAVSASLTDILGGGRGVGAMQQTPPQQPPPPVASPPPRGALSLQEEQIHPPPAGTPPPGALPTTQHTEGEERPQTPSPYQMNRLGSNSQPTSSVGGTAGRLTLHQPMFMSPEAPSPSTERPPEQQQIIEFNSQRTSASMMGAQHQSEFTNAPVVTPTATTVTSTGDNNGNRFSIPHRGTSMLPHHGKAPAAHQAVPSNITTSLDRILQRPGRTGGHPEAAAAPQEQTHPPPPAPDASATAAMRNSLVSSLRIPRLSMSRSSARDSVSMPSRYTESNAGSQERQMEDPAGGRRSPSYEGVLSTATSTSPSAAPGQDFTPSPTFKTTSLADILGRKPPSQELQVVPPSQDALHEERHDKDEEVGGDDLMLDIVEDGSIYDPGPSDGNGGGGHAVSMPVSSPASLADTAAFVSNQPSPTKLLSDAEPHPQSWDPRAASVSAPELCVSPASDDDQVHRDHQSPSGRAEMPSAIHNAMSPVQPLSTVTPVKSAVWDTSATSSIIGGLGQVSNVAVAPPVMSPSAKQFLSSAESILQQTSQFLARSNRPSKQSVHHPPSSEQLGIPPSGLSHHHTLHQSSISAVEAGGGSVQLWSKPERRLML